MVQPVVQRVRAPLCEAVPVEGEAPRQPAEDMAKGSSGVPRDPHVNRASAHLQAEEIEEERGQMQLENVAAVRRLDPEVDTLANRLPGPIRPDNARHDWSTSDHVVAVRHEPLRRQVQLELGLSLFIALGGGHRPEPEAHGDHSYS